MNSWFQAAFLAAVLLPLSSCAKLESEGWGSTTEDHSWITDLDQDEASRVPGLSEGAIAKVQLLNGDSSLRITLWSNYTGHSYTSGGGPKVRTSFVGSIFGGKDETIPFSFTTQEESTAKGSIGDETFVVQGSALILVYTDEEGTQCKQIDVPAEAMAAFDISGIEKIKAFAAEWDVDDFFKTASGG